MKTEKPIYSIIEDSIIDGRLPDDFVLPDAEGFSGDSRLKMAPGARDGIYIYHMPKGDLSDEGKAKFSAAVQEAVQAASFGAANAYEQFEVLSKEYSAITIIDDLQDYIRQHTAEIDKRELLRFAVEELIFGAIDCECLKYGLIITELFGEFVDDFKEVFRKIGLYDEFSIFVVFNMQTWKNGNEEILGLAKRVDGWGKIHAVERLKPVTQEIRDWILYNGVDNDVMPEYLALTCMVKSDAAKRLIGNPTKEEFSAISHILKYLFDEGPVWGISGLPDGKGTLEHYLICAEKQELGSEDYEAILEIRNYAAEKEDFLSLAQHANRILHSEQCVATVRDAVKRGEGIRLAEMLNIPYKESLLKLVERNFEESFFWCDTLLKDPDYLDPILTIYRKEVPLESIEQDPRDEHEMEEKNKKYFQMNLMLRNLSRYPGKGEDYLMKAISAPVKRSRVLTVEILKAWVEKRKIPLMECFPALFDCLGTAYYREPSKEIKEGIFSLLHGATSFDD